MLGNHLFSRTTNLIMFWFLYDNLWLPLVIRFYVIQLEKFLCYHTNNSIFGCIRDKIFATIKEYRRLCTLPNVSTTLDFTLFRLMFFFSESYLPHLNNMMLSEIHVNIISVSLHNCGVLWFNLWLNEEETNMKWLLYLLHKHIFGNEVYSPMPHKKRTDSIQFHFANLIATSFCKQAKMHITFNIIWFFKWR